MKTTIKFYGTELKVSGLKRECEIIKEVFDKLSGIKSYQLQYSGIKKEGEEPKGMLAWVMFQTHPLRDAQAFNEKIESFKQSLPSELTFEIVKTLKPQIDSIFYEHVFIDDSRITEAEAAEKAIQRNNQEIERQKESNNRIELIGLGDGDESVTLKDDEMFLTVQAYFNDSHSQSDYFHPHHSIGTEYALAIVRKGARRESIVRDLIKSTPELAKLEWEWNDSFMSSEGVGRLPYPAYDGRTEVGYWYEIHFSNYKKALPKSRLFIVEQSKEKIQGAAPTGDKIATCKLNPSKNGIELYFNSKPLSSVLDDLKANGWRWSRFNSCWYKTDNSIARKLASKYAEVPNEASSSDAQLVQAQEDAAIANENY